MKHLHKSRIITALLLSWLSLCLAASIANAQKSAVDFDNNWEAGFWKCGFNGPVNTFADYDNLVAIGGSFQRVGNVLVNNVTLFDKQSMTYYPLGDGVDSSVQELANYRGNLIALIASNQTQDPPAQEIKIWDGSSWSRLGDLLPEFVTTLTVSNNELFAGGYHWNGSSWNKIINTNGIIDAQISWNGLLICSGSFSEVNGVSVSNIVTWDGAIALPLGAGLDAKTKFLCIQNNNLVAGGRFRNSGDVELYNIALWDGSNWSTPNSSKQIYPYSSELKKLAVYQNRLISWYVVSLGFNAGYATMSIQNGDGTWSDVFESGQYYPVMASHEVDGKLFLGGSFDGMEGAGSTNFVTYDDNGAHTTQATGLGTSGAISNLSEYYGRLVVTGSFSSVGHMYSPAAAFFVGYAWMPANQAYFNGQNITLGRIHSFEGAISTGNGVSGILYEQQADYAENRLLVWDEIGIPGWRETDDNIVPAKYHAGSLYGISGNVYHQENNSWVQAGGEFDGRVYGLESWDWHLLAWGNFDSVGGAAANNIAGFNGSNWYALGTGLPEAVECLEMFNGDPVVSYRSGSLYYVSHWNGSEWEILGEAFDRKITCLKQYGDHLYVGGEFTKVGNRLANKIAWWNDQNWFPYGVGVGQNQYNTAVTDMAVYNNKLYVSGRFSSAGNKIADNLACLPTPLPSTTAVNDNNIQMPVMALLPNIPNPFNPKTAINFSLANAGHLKVAVYDLKGRWVRTLANREFSAGNHSLNWDGNNGSGQSMASGVYVTKMVGAAGEVSRKITMAR